MTPHIEAKKGEIAKIVIMPGDPLRAQMIAENYLENPKLVTKVRGILGFTGTYKGKDVTQEWDAQVWEFILMNYIMNMM